MADNPSVAGLAQKFEETIRGEKRKLEEEREELEQQRAALEKERESMSLLAGRDEDILELSVGGRRFSVTRAVLTQEEGLLAGMFSGRWDTALPRDRSGRTFFDLDPDCFDVVLHHLRDRRLTGKAVRWRQVRGPSGKEEHFANLLHFLGLTQGQASRMVYAFGATASGVTRLSTAAISIAGDGHKWALSETVMEEGVYTWNFVMRSLPGDWAFVGVIGTEPANIPDTSYRDITAYGWGSEFQCICGIVATGNKQRIPVFRTGDEVLMRFNADTGVLEMRVASPRGRAFQLTVSGRHPWRAFANLFHSGSSVKLTDGDF